MPKAKKIEQSSNIPEISEREHNFVIQRVIEGKSYLEAYKNTHNVKNLSHTAIAARAFRLSHSDRIKAWERELRTLGAIESQVTLESHIARLRQISEIAIDRDQLGAAVAAEKHIGQAVGLYIDKKEYTHKHETSALSLLEELKESVQVDKGPEIKH